MSPFDQAVNREMRALAQIDAVRFYGQSVKYDGAAIHASLEGVPDKKRIEMPVAEDFQLGFCIGAALAGILPVCIFPRMDFMLLCMNQLVNHLDKLPVFGWRPKVIIRTTVGKTRPLDAGPQHTQNHCQAVRRMLRDVALMEVNSPQEVALAYQWAGRSTRSSMIVENEQ